MIVGLGSDLCSIERIAKSQDMWGFDGVSTCT